MAMELVPLLCRQGTERARQPAGRILLRSAQAGAYVALAAQLAVTAGLGAQATLGYGPTQILTGLVFCLGLVLVVLGGAELFTGCNLIVGAAAFSREVRPAELLRQWGLCYLGNLLGALVVTALWVGSDLWQQGSGEWAARAVAIADAKAGLAFWPALLRGIGCNVLVCLAVLFAAGAEGTAGKILAVIFPVTAFAALGFEHSVANMFYLPAGLWLAKLRPDLAAPHLSVLAILHNLVPVTIGNIIGGAFLVGGSYWWASVLPAARPEKGTGRRVGPGVG